MNEVRKVRVAFRFDPHIVARLRKASEDEGVTITRIIEKSVSHCLAMPSDRWLRKSRQERRTA